MTRPSSIKLAKVLNRFKQRRVYAIAYTLLCFAQLDI